MSDRKRLKNNQKQNAENRSPDLWIVEIKYDVVFIKESPSYQIFMNKKEDYTWGLPTSDGHKVVYTGNYIKAVTFPSSLYASFRYFYK